MADYSDLDPTALRRSVSDGTRLKKSITTDLYTGGTPTAANQVKRSIMYADGTLKESIANASGLKPSWLIAGSGGGAWTPSDLGIDLLAHYDASNSGSITHSAGAVSQWNDLSGNGRHVSQGTGSAQPTWDMAEGIDFDGVGTFLENSSPFMYDNIGVHLYIVATMGSGGQFVTEGRSTSDLSRYNFLESGDNLYAYYRTNTGLVRLNAQMSNSSELASSASKVAFSFEDTAGGNMKGVVGGVEKLNTNYSRATTTFDRFGIGALLRIGEASFLDAEINEIVITGELSGDDRANMYSYFSTKWGT